MVPVTLQSDSVHIAAEALAIAPSLRGWAFIAGGILPVISLVQGHRAPVIENYEVRLAALPAMDGTVRVFAFDFHLGTQLGRNWLDLRIPQIQFERPDVVVLGGDNRRARWLLRKPSVV